MPSGAVVPKRTKHLDAEFTVFGRVQDGMGVARRITQDDKIKAIRVRGDND